MKRKRVALTVLLSVMLIVCIGIGMNLGAFADGTAGTDANGWKTTAENEDGTDAVHKIGEDGFTTFTSVKDGDRVTYAQPIKLPYADTYGSGTRLSYFVPFRMDIKAKGTGKIKWTLSANKIQSVDPATGERTYGSELIPFLAGTMKIGGNAFDENLNMDSFTQKTIPEGEALSIIFREFSANWIKGVYPTADNESEAAFHAGGKAYQSVSLSNDSTSNTWYGPEVAYLTVEVVETGEDDVEEVAVNVSEGIEFVEIDADRTWHGIDPGYAIFSNDIWHKSTGAGLYKQVDGQQNIVGIYSFANIPSSFTLCEGADKMPYVTVAGQRVDADMNGVYRFTTPAGAQTSKVTVGKGEFTVTYRDGDAELLKNYIKSGDKASSPYVESKGKVVKEWYSDAALSSKFDFGKALTGDTVIYVEWKDITVVTFESDGAEYGWQNVETGGTATLPPGTPEKAGMYFMGWYADETFDVPFDFTTAIDTNTTVYAGFGYKVEFRILGYGGGSQSDFLLVKDGGKVLEDGTPGFDEVTGYPAYTNMKITWYTDQTMTEEVDFGTSGLMISGNLSMVGAVSDVSLEEEDTRVSPNVNGWDTNNGVLYDEDGNALSVENYGHMGKMEERADGYTYININFVGYIVNARSFDVTKDIYLDYTLDSKNEGEGKYDHLKWFMFGLYNNLTGALAGMGQEYTGNYGSLATFGHLVATPATTIDNWHGSGQSIADAFHYAEKEQIHLIIRIGATMAESGIYQVYNGQEVKVMSLNLQRSMFPDGLYLTLSPFRITWAEVRATQQSSITKGAAKHGSYALDKTEGLAGERVIITPSPDEGYLFSDEGVFVDGEAVKVSYDETAEHYYFNMPFGTGEITVNFGVEVTFMAGETELTKLTVVTGNLIDEYYVPSGSELPERTGYVFSGWCTDPELTKDFDLKSDKPDAKMTLYAKYVPETYTATLLSDGDTYQTLTAQYGGKFQKPADPTREGYTFEGWYTDSACTTAYDFETAAAGNLTLYAKWTEAKKGGCNGCAAGTAISAAMLLALSLARKKFF